MSSSIASDFCFSSFYSSDFKSQNSSLAETSLSHSAKFCVGVDPHLTGMPDFLLRKLSESRPERFLSWFGDVFIEKALEHDLQAMKFQSAFFESFGSGGVKALKNLISRAKDNGILTVLDAKRGDISSTMHAYGHTAFEYMNADILTVTLYMGYDVIAPLEPWLKEGRGVYVVLVTSNPGASKFQFMPWPGGSTVSQMLFDEIEERASDAGISKSIGYVVGATKVDDLDQAFFSKLEQRPLLIPGLGAQGGTLSGERASKLLSRPNLIPVSRAVSGFGSGYLDEGLAGISVSDYPEFVGRRLAEVSSQFKSL